MHGTFPWPVSRTPRVSASPRTGPQGFYPTRQPQSPGNTSRRGGSPHPLRKGVPPHPGPGSSSWPPQFTLVVVDGVVNREVQTRTLILTTFPELGKCYFAVSAICPSLQVFLARAIKQEHVVRLLNGCRGAFDIELGFDPSTIR